MAVPVYSISIALMEKKEVLLGVILEINQKECFYTWNGSPSWLNGRQIRVSETNRLADSLLATGFPYYDYSRLGPYLNFFRFLLEHSHGIRRLGSAAADLAYVACGRVEGFYEYGLSPWDVAAGTILVKNAGGKVTDFNSGENFIFGKEIVATNDRIFQEIYGTFSRNGLFNSSSYRFIVMKKTGFLLFTSCWIPLFMLAQEGKKTVVALPVSVSPKIDGILDEEAWSKAPVAGEFIQRKPFNGKPTAFRTEVRFLYDNSGLYVGAMMYDPLPDSILTQLGLRDSQGLNSDYFMLILSPFNDGINAFCFMVYASDVQVDFKIPGGSSYVEGDMSWDAVWLSKARKNDQGWVVEMKIPYSAIRFPKTTVQHWGINCQRDIRRYREAGSWNFVDSKIDGYVNQGGLLEGIKDIRPPLRLSLSPYVSGYMQKNPGDPQWQFTYNYGADLKYGINESFTLDMTLIPDFGQVPSDDKIYNFSPFEIQYNEKRQFFTEGTELFNKTGIFYSRRIGGQPKGMNTVSDSLFDREKVLENPTQTRLLNATKVSGRTSHGLGIGIFNAISGNTWAKVQDTITGNVRRILTQGFTNYNMIVLDQALKNNSYFDFVNTNYHMNDNGYTANVTGIAFKIANKNYTYAFMGDAFISQKYYTHSSSDLGYHYNLAFGKLKGNFLFTYNQLLETDRYDPNDMGFNDRNNKFINVLVLNYNLYEPFGKFLDATNRLQFAYNCLYDEFKYSSFVISGESNHHFPETSNYRRNLQPDSTYTTTIMSPGLKDLCIFSRRNTSSHHGSQRITARN